MAERLSHFHSAPQIGTAVLRGLRIPFAEYQVDMDALLILCDIDPALLNDADAFVPLSKYLIFMETAGQRNNDPLFSMKLARSAGPETLGAIGFLFLSSPTLFEALSNLAKYVNLLQGATNLDVTSDEGNIVLTYELVALDSIEPIQDVQFSLALIYRLIKMYIGRRIEGIVICFRHAPIADIADYQRHINADFEFNSDNNAIFLTKAAGILTSNILDTSLSNILSSMLDKQLDLNDARLTFCERVESVVFSYFSTKLPTAEGVAGRIGVSTATLHRRLRDEQSSFRAITDLKTRRIAEEFLVYSHLSITAIALRCGYAESASFTKAFKRIFGGQTPSKFRSSHRKRQKRL